MGEHDERVARFLRLSSHLALPPLFFPRVPHGFPFLARMMTRFTEKLRRESWGHFDHYSTLLLLSLLRVPSSEKFNYSFAISSSNLYIHVEIRGFLLDSKRFSIFST